MSKKQRASLVREARLRLEVGIEQRIPAIERRRHDGAGEEQERDVLQARRIEREMPAPPECEEEQAVLTQPETDSAVAMPASAMSGNRVSASATLAATATPAKSIGVFVSSRAK